MKTEPDRLTHIKEIEPSPTCPVQVNKKNSNPLFILNHSDLKIKSKLNVSFSHFLFSQPSCFTTPKPYISASCAAATCTHNHLPLLSPSLFLRLMVSSPASLTLQILWLPSSLNNVSSSLFVGQSIHQKLSG